MTTLAGDQPPFSPAADRWPAGHRAALCLTINVSAAADEAEPPVAPIDPGYERAGANRMLRLLADTGVAATWTWSQSAITADDGLIDQVRAGGHELAARIEDRPADIWRDALRDFRDDLMAAADVNIVGVKAAGRGVHGELYRAGQELGFGWVLAEPAGDLPALLRPDGERPPIVHLPASRWFDDRQLFGERVIVARHAFEAWRDDLDTIRDEGGLMVLSLHPSVGGRPGPSRAIAQFLDYAIDTGDLWITRADHLALWWAERHGPG